MPPNAQRHIWRDRSRYKYAHPLYYSTAADGTLDEGVWARDTAAHVTAVQENHVWLKKKRGTEKSNSKLKGPNILLLLELYSV